MITTNELIEGLCRMADQPAPRCRFQFRLRTLLLVVTLAAVACWVVVDRQRLIRERDEALDQKATATEQWRRERLASELLTMKLEALKKTNHDSKAAIDAPLSPATQP
jgi:hypothetical protein